MAQSVTAKPTQRLTNILDEIERRDVELERAFAQLESARVGGRRRQYDQVSVPDHDEPRAAYAAQRYHRLRELLMEVAEENGFDTEHTI